MSKRFTKSRKVIATGVATRGSDIVFGTVALKALECGKITKKQAESVRVTVSKNCGKKGKFWHRINHFIGVTGKPIGVRMGGGKGSIEEHIGVVSAGAILFEVGNVDAETAVFALTKAAYKLNIECKVVFRRFTPPVLDGEIEEKIN